MPTINKFPLDWLNRLVPVAGFKPVGQRGKRLLLGSIPKPVSRTDSIKTTEYRITVPARVKREEGCISDRKDSPADPPL